MIKKMKQQILNWIKENELYQVSSKHSKREQKVKGVILTEATLRSIADNEIVIEFDIDLTTRAKFNIHNTIKRLNSNGYSFAIFDHKSRSPHIHIYGIKGLNEQDKNVVRKYKQFFMNKYAPYADYSLCGDHLVAMEFKPHFKYGTTKELVRIYGNNLFDNIIELELLEKAINYIAYNKKRNEYIDNTGNEWFINWVNAEINDFPIGNRHMIIAKNYAILMKDNKDMLKKLPVWFQPEVRGWSNWVEEVPRTFGIHEIYRFGDMYGYSINKIKKDYGGVSQDDVR